MTDTYAEYLLIKRFLEMEGLEKVEIIPEEDDEEEIIEEIELEDDEELEEEVIENSPNKDKNKDEDTKEIEYFYPEVAFPNEAFTRPEDGYWYEISMIPAVPNQIELGTTARSRWTGIMQINICVPKDSGTKAMNARFNAIAALFRSGLYIEGVRVVRTYRTSALDDGDFTVMPVSVEWWADLDRGPVDILMKPLYTIPQNYIEPDDRRSR